ncbi:MAG TPA: hypothetical protein VGM54_10150 [Chthoniobacter sp.]|jgi:hypothetical protein
MNITITGYAVADLLATANRWREDRGFVGKLGFVVIWHGAVCGWTAGLKAVDPSAWRPGCILVPEDEGSFYRLAGGGAQQGAERLERVEVIGGIIQ